MPWPGHGRWKYLATIPKRKNWAEAALGSGFQLAFRDEISAGRESSETTWEHCTFQEIKCKTIEKKQKNNKKLEVAKIVTALRAFFNVFHLLLIACSGTTFWANNSEAVQSRAPHALRGVRLAGGSCEDADSDSEGEAWSPAFCILKTFPGRTSHKICCRAPWTGKTPGPLFKT